MLWRWHTVANLHSVADSTRLGFYDVGHKQSISYFSVGGGGGCGCRQGRGGGSLQGILSGNGSDGGGGCPGSGMFSCPKNIFMTSSSGALAASIDGAVDHHVCLVEVWAVVRVANSLFYPFFAGGGGGGCLHKRGGGSPSRRGCEGGAGGGAGCLLLLILMATIALCVESAPLLHLGISSSASCPQPLRSAVPSDQTNHAAG